MERPHVRARIGRRVAALGSLAGALLLLAAAVVAPAQAAPGDLDLTFSGDGKQTTDFPGGSSAAAIARQSDGKVVAVGSAFGAFTLARYNTNGTLDTSFSADGKKTTDFGANDGANGVAIQPNGKIVVVGETIAPEESFSHFALARYNPNGSLDTSFSGDGKQTTDFGDFDLARGVALQANGKIVVAGTNGGINFELARYNPNGSLDTTFSGDGRQTTDFGGLDEATGVALQADGKIVAVGGSFSGGQDFALARYNPSGSLDTSFSGDGKQRTDFGGSEFATGMTLQGDGKIIAVGHGFVGDFELSDFKLARYNPNGSLDTSFSGDGKQTTNFGSFEQANGVALQGDGKIVAVGRTAPDPDFALARYNANGSLDTTFSGDGKQTTNFGSGEVANGVALQGGKIIAAGFGGAGGDFALARYNPNGSLDTTFSGDGKLTTEFGGGFDQANGVAIQADGKIIAVGFGDAGGDAFALARYNANGSLDTTFSGDGKQTTVFEANYRANAVAIQPNGKLVVAGRAGGGGFRFALARYNPNGSLDTTFSGDGKQTTEFGGAGGGVNAVALQADGKIVAVGGLPALGASDDFLIARYNPNGSLDTSFSGDGKQRTDFGSAEGANGVALEGDGKIVAVGQALFGDFALARYNTNGSLDTSFSGDGKQTTDFGGNDEANGVAIQADGKIVAVGDGDIFFDPPAGVFALARYNTNGSLDTSFSGDGKQTTDFGAGGGANGVALQGDGKIVAVGAGLGLNQTPDFGLARYLAG